MAAMLLILARTAARRRVTLIVRVHWVSRVD